MPDPNPPQYPIKPSDPLLALRKATGIGADVPATSQITVSEMPLGPGGPLSGLKGAVKSAVGGAEGALPALKNAPGEAITALWNLLHTEPPPVDPIKVWRAERMTSARPPSAGRLNIPAGFTFPPEFEPTTVQGVKDVGFGQSPATAYRERQWRAALEPPSGYRPVTPTGTLAQSGVPHGGTGLVRSAQVATVLNEDMVRDMRAMRDAGASFAEIQTQYPKVKEGTLRSALTGQSWTAVK